MIKYIVFDFDGTLADTFEVIKNIIQKDYEVSEKDFELLKEMGLKKIIKKLNIPYWQVPKISSIIMSKLKDNSNIKIFPGIIDILCELKNNYKLGIVSSNTKENITKILRENKIENLFEFIYSNSSIFGKHLVLKKMCKKLNIKPSELIYVGDEDRDIIAAKKLNIKSMAVTWGFNSEKRLEKENPDYIASSPGQILEKLA